MESDLDGAMILSKEANYSLRRLSRHLPIMPQSEGRLASADENS